MTDTLFEIDKAGAYCDKSYEYNLRWFNVVRIKFPIPVVIKDEVVVWQHG